MTVKKFDDCYIDSGADISIIGFNDDEKTKAFLKQLIFFEFRVNEGQQVKEGDVLVVAEAMKGTSQLKSRISGKVISVNKVLEDKIEKLSSNPKEWLIKIQTK